MKIENFHLMKIHPRRLLKWREDSEGKVVILRPKLGDGALGCWISLRLRNPYYYIYLDDVGTLVWKRCDGKTGLSCIVTHVRQQFGERVEPVEQRLLKFIKQLREAKLIEFVDEVVTEPQRRKTVPI